MIVGTPEWFAKKRAQKKAMLCAALVGLVQAIERDEVKPDSIVFVLLDHEKAMVQWRGQPSFEELDLAVAALKAKIVEERDRQAPIPSPTGLDA